VGLSLQVFHIHKPNPTSYFTSSQTLPELGKKLLGKRQLVEDKSNPVKKQATCIAPQILTKSTCNQLRECCKAKGLPITGNKATLIKRLENQPENQSESTNWKYQYRDVIDRVVAKFDSQEADSFWVWLPTDSFSPCLLLYLFKIYCIYSTNIKVPARKFVHFATAHPI
jgi:hypothetical protein